MENNKIKDEPSEFLELNGIEYFLFEEDFMEANVRCIPMTVRFKMDAAGIKLKLGEWSKFKIQERIELALKPCDSIEEKKMYKNYLVELIKKYTVNEPTLLEINPNPDWANLKVVPKKIVDKAKEFNWIISIAQWQGLTMLQRYALLKLCKPGHENRNFPVAVKEFNFF